MAQCPVHDDSKASLSISVGRDGKPLVHCHAGCAQEAVVAKLKDLGAWPEKPSRKRGSLGDIIATYDYVDEDGKLVFQVTRHTPKDFRQRRRARAGDDPANVRDGWVWSI
jgi:hypothetical protein